MEYEFTLKFTLAAEDGSNMDQLVERLGEAGCNDALVGIGQSGRIGLDFTRDAGSAKQAIFSALEEVKHAIPSAKLLEVPGGRSKCLTPGRGQNASVDAVNRRRSAPS